MVYSATKANAYDQNVYIVGVEDPGCAHALEYTRVLASCGRIRAEKGEKEELVFITNLCDARARGRKTWRVDCGYA